jgi:hypothetical protein
MNRAAIHGNRFQFSNASNINHGGRRGQTQLQHGNQTLPAGKNLAVFAVLVEQGQGFFDGSWREVLKIVRDHVFHFRDKTSTQRYKGAKVQRLQLGSVLCSFEPLILCVEFWLGQFKR